MHEQLINKSISYSNPNSNTKRPNNDLNQLSPINKWTRHMFSSYRCPQNY